MSHKMGLHLEQVAVPMRQQTVGLQCNSVRSILLKRTVGCFELSWPKRL